LTPKNWQSLVISPKGVWECLRIENRDQEAVEDKRAEPEALHKSIKKIKIKGKRSRKNKGKAGDNNLLEE